MGEESADMTELEFYKEMYRRECAETDRLRAIIARNCDPGEAKILSGYEDAEAIFNIQEKIARAALAPEQPK